MSNWKPLAYMITLTFLVSIAMYFVVSPFIDTTVVNPTSSDYINTMISYSNQSFIGSYEVGILGFSFKLPSFNFLGIFSYFPSTQDYIVSQLIILSYIPNIILIPFIVLWVMALVWTMVALIKPGSS